MLKKIQISQIKIAGIFFEKTKKNIESKIIKTVKYSVGACFDMKEKPKKSGVKNQNNLLFSLIAKIKQ